MTMTKTITTLVALASLIAMGMVCHAQQGKGTDRPVIGDGHPKAVEEPEGGWLMRPHPFRVGRAWGEAGERGVIVTGFSSVEAGGVLRVFLVQCGAGALHSTDCRLVVLDRGGGRHVVKADEGGRLKNFDTEVKHAIFTLDPKVVAADKISEIAVERIKLGQGRGAQKKGQE
jgi:hypothetical protein